MSGRRKSGGGGSGRKNNKGRKAKKQQTPSSSGRGRGANNGQRQRRSSLPNERTRFDGASPTGRSFMREDAYFRMKFLEEQELLANMMRVNQRKRQKESPSRRPFSQRRQSDSDSESDSGSIDSDVVADYAMNISSDEDLGSLHESMKGLTADENFNVLRQYDEEIIGTDEESGESDEGNQIKNQVSKFNLSKKTRKRREKKIKKKQNLVHAVVNKQNNRFVEPADFEDERPSLDAYLGTDREYYVQDDYYQVPEAVLSNADKLRNKYLKMLAQTSFVRAKDPASFLEPAKDPSITTVTMTTTTTSTTTSTSTLAPVNTDTIIQKVETISISKNNNEEVKTETVTVVEEKKEKPDVKMEEFKDKMPVLNEKLPEYRYEQVTEIKIVTSTTPGNSNNNTPKQQAKSVKNQNKNKTKNNKKVEPVEEKIEFEWVGDESESDEDEDDIVIDEDIEEDDEEDEEDDLSDIDVADLIIEDDDEEDDEDDEEDEEDESEEDMPVQYVFDRDSGLSKKEQSLMLYWAQEDEMKRQARRRNRRPAGSESEDSDLSEEEFLDMQDIDDEESSEEDEQFTRILNSNYSPKDQRQFTTPSPKGKRMPRDSIGFPGDEEKPSPHNRSQEKPMSAKQRKLARNNQPGVKVSKKKIKKLNKLYKKGNQKRRLTRNDIEYWSQIMVEFIKDENMETKSVSNMNKFQLMQLAKLAKFYNLKASMAGSGKRRYAVVHKTEHSRLRNEEDLKKFLNRFFPEEEEITRRNGESRYGRSGQGPRTKVNTRKDMHTRVLVGNSMPIPESNLGHIMMVRMGWIGGGLGSQKQGIEEPIQPVIRPRGRGLGFTASSL